MTEQDYEHEPGCDDTEKRPYLELLQQVLRL
jgi:hypothetical protein